MDDRHLISTQVTCSINSRSQVLVICELMAEDLKISSSENAYAFLVSLAEKESALGSYNLPRYEPNYGPGGLLYQKSEDLKTSYRRYGALAACSWGPFQIMYIVAKEVGYIGHPIDLHTGLISAPYVMKKLNANIRYGANTVDKLAASYNAGPGCLKRKKLWPKKYVDDFMLIYSKNKAKYRLERG